MEVFNLNIRFEIYISFISGVLQRSTLHFHFHFRVDYRIAFCVWSIWMNFSFLRWKIGFSFVQWCIFNFYTWTFLSGGYAGGYAGGYYGHAAPVVAAPSYGVSKVVSPYGVAPSVYGSYGGYGISHHGIAAAPVGMKFVLSLSFFFSNCRKL